MSFHISYLLNLASIACGREPQRPLLFSYYLTHRCPMNCRYCSDGEGNPFKAIPVLELDTDAAMRLITILSRSADTLDITGGEPMMRPDLEEILDHAQRQGMRTVLDTKGIGLASRPELMRTDVLVLSVDSLRPEKLCKIYGCDLHQAKQVLEALDFALSARGRTKTQVVLSAVAMPDNLEDVAEVLEFAASHNLGFHLSPQIEGIRANTELLKSRQYGCLIDFVIDKKNAGSGLLGTSEYLKGIRDFRPFRCHPLLMPVIRPDGKLLYPCLEQSRGQVDVLAAGCYSQALRLAKAQHGPLPRCFDCCHIFCHMALSLLQRHPFQALREGRHWAAIKASGNDFPREACT